MMEHLGLGLFVLSVALLIVGSAIARSRRSAQQAKSGHIAIRAAEEMAAPVEITLWVRVGVTSVLLAAALFVILSKTYPADEQKWAYGVVGTILGYWLKS